MLETGMDLGRGTGDLHIHIRCKNCRQESQISHLRFPFDEHDDVSTTCQHCGTDLHFGDYAKWKYPHLFRVHIEYHDLAETEVQFHLQRLAARPSDAARMELYLCGTETSVSVGKHKLRTKSDRLSFLLRTSSIGSEALAELRTELEAEGHDLRLRYSPKRKLLSQISVLLSIDDPMMPIMATNLIGTVAKKVGCPEPLICVAGYYAGLDEPGLPGRKVMRFSPSMAGVLLGLITGCVIGFVAALLWS